MYFPPSSNSKQHDTKSERAALQGRRVKLLRINDPYVHIPAGTCGTIRRIDDAGTVHVDWDNGDSLGLCADAGDRWILLP
jgi:Domain of unknown function (DUF4314)